MTELAPYNTPNRRHRFLRKRKRMKKRTQILALRNTEKSTTKNTFLTFLFLMSIFAILAYFRPH